MVSEQQTNGTVWNKLNKRMLMPILGLIYYQLKSANYVMNIVLVPIYDNDMAMFLT